MQNVIILSGPVQSGKSTALKKWLQNKAAKGILCHDENAVRYITNLATSETRKLTAEDDEPSFQIGKWSFSREGFSFGRKALESIIVQNYDLIIVDEIGKLELAEDGFHQEFSQLIAQMKDAPFALCIVVIRSELLEQLQTKYSLFDCLVVTNETIDLLQDLSVGILCGGKSSRMGREKYLIRYHQLPQYQHLYNMSVLVCRDAVLSISASQIDHIRNLPYVIDAQLDQGPGIAVLSLLQACKAQYLLVLACDYPELSFADFFRLVSNVQESKALAYSKDGFYIPVLAIYRTDIVQELEEFLEHNGASLQRYLKLSDAKAVPARSELKSIDLPIE